MIEMQRSEWAGSRGYLCDVQGEVQVSIPACLWPVFAPLLFSGKPTRPHCAPPPQPGAQAKFGKSKESRIYSY